MAAILNSAILDSDTAILDSNTLLSSLRFTQKHSSSTLTLTQTNSIWLTGWWQPSWILPSWIQPFYIKLWLNLSSIWLKLIHSDSTWWWQPSWILPSWIQTHLGYQTNFWLNSLLNSAILDSLISLWFPTQTHSIDDDGSHLEFCHLGFSHLHKKTSLMHSHSNWWLQPSWILLSWIQPFCTKKKLHLFILTQLDDGSHLEFCHVGFRHCHLGFRHLVIFSQIHSKTLFLYSDFDSN